MIRQWQQKVVMEKNAVSFEIIQKALPLPPKPKVGENEQQVSLKDPLTAVVERTKEGVSKGGALTIPDELIPLSRVFSLKPCVVRLCCNGRHLVMGRFH